MNDTARNDHSPWAVFLIFFRLGLTSFGGPIAHLGYFRDEFVTRRQWLTERSYADLVALCQFLPGPASSQVGIALGLSRAGYIPGRWQHGPLHATVSSCTDPVCAGDDQLRGCDALWCIAWAESGSRCGGRASCMGHGPKSLPGYTAYYCHGSGNLLCASCAIGLGDRWE
ncbi:Chromate transport protein ChrA [Klebsiella pneumoniae]|nr:Chromate transport protein ChrA [Klebsiella pneumoniae]